MSLNVPEEPQLRPPTTSMGPELSYGGDAVLEVSQVSWTDPIPILVFWMDLGPPFFSWMDLASMFVSWMGPLQAGGCGSSAPPLSHPL